MDFISQANAAPYTMTGTAQLEASTKDVADSGFPALASAIGIIIPLLIYGFVKVFIMRKT